MKRLKEEGNADKIKEIFEAFFIFALMWSYGASLDEDKNSFNGSIRAIITGNLKFPEGGQIFDYFYDVIEGGWKHWDTMCDSFDKEYEGLFSNLVVPTAETTR